MWLYEALVTESRWIAPCIGLAAILAVRSFRRAGRAGGEGGSAALSVFAGTLIGLLAAGHLFAVLLKLAVGDLGGSLPVLLTIGIVLALPSWAVARHGWELARGDRDVGRQAVILNLLLIGCLLVTGPLNAPLAIPAGLAALYAWTPRERIRRVIMVATVLFVTLLFAGSVRFFMSGQSFEDFSRVEAR